MRTTLLYYWDSLRTSYWFVPAIVCLLSAILAFSTIALDRAIHERTFDETVWWIYSGGPEGARGVLSTIAGSMITVAGVVFSITIVALSLASGQFGSRLLRNFIRDRSNQFVLGTFTGTFIYCLLVLRTVRGTDSQQFVPGLAVAVGIVLALASLGVLIYFIHHVAVAIQADSVIAAVSREMRETIDRLWPDALDPEHALDAAPEPAGLPAEFELGARPVSARGSGYVAAVEVQTLLALAHKRGLIIKLVRRPGHFAIRGSALAVVWPGIQVVDELQHAVNGAYLLEVQRTPYQDVQFTINQLVEIAVRALSPGINDPFTAMICIDWLGAALGRLAARAMPSPYRYDDENQLRLIVPAVSFADLTDSAFNQIRQYGHASATVMIHMLNMLETIGQVVLREGDRRALAHHARLIRQAAEENLEESADRAEVEARYWQVANQLSPHDAPAP